MILSNITLFDHNGVIFDVGANIGGYALEVIKLFPDVTIHCFEPGYMSFNKLINNTRNYSDRIQCNNVGIGCEETECMLYYEKEESGIASVFNREVSHFGLSYEKKKRLVLLQLIIIVVKTIFLI